MEQRDILKDQIEQLGRVLGQILSDFLKIKSKGDVEQGMEISNQRLQSELDIDIEKLISLSNDGLKEYLNTRKLNESHLEILSEYLIEHGKAKTSKIEQELYFTKAIKLLDIADEVSKTVSFERMNKKDEIENVLQQSAY